MVEDNRPTRVHETTAQQARPHRVLRDLPQNRAAVQAGLFSNASNIVLVVGLVDGRVGGPVGVVGGQVGVGVGVGRHAGIAAIAARVATV